MTKFYYFKWYRNKDEVNPTADFEISYREGRVSLSIPEVFPEDSGNFTCQASNAAGQEESSAQLIVKAALLPPKFIEPLQSQEVVEGEPVQFLVRIASNPPASGML